MVPPHTNIQPTNSFRHAFLRPSASELPSVEVLGFRERDKCNLLPNVNASMERLRVGSAANISGDTFIRLPGAGQLTISRQHFLTGGVKQPWSGGFLCDL
jgi:hypothetical protein